MKVIILQEVLDYLDELVITLYEKNYFGFEESSKKYVKELFIEIKTTLPIRSHQPAPKHFEKYGKNLHYAVFNKSNRTTWYAFFTKYRQNDDIIYLVRYLSNNHVTGQFLNND